MVAGNSIQIIVFQIDNKKNTYMYVYAGMYM